jgi:hypothetical protein
MPITPSIPPAIQEWLSTINTTWPTFQIEKDKKYILENGEIIGPMIPTNDSDGFAWKFPHTDKRCYRYWNNKGIRWCVKSRPMENIKSEYIEPEPTNNTAHVPITTGTIISSTPLIFRVHRSELFYVNNFGEVWQDNKNITEDDAALAECFRQWVTLSCGLVVKRKQ